MRKIPTVFLRDPDDPAHLLRTVHPDCGWVLDGEGIPTRKYDGICVRIRRDGLAVHAYVRREVKDGGQPPEGFEAIQFDAVTGKTVGWEPAELSGFGKFVGEAIERWPAITPGTYELVGPKINRNPEDYALHTLLEHDTADRMENWFTDPELFLKAPTYDTIRDTCHAARALAHAEGIVWHHPDGRMAKAKAKDFAE